MLVAGVKRFHDYLYSRPFELLNDHKLLLGLLARDRQSPQILLPRMTRRTVFLAAYSYTLFYSSGKHLGPADTLSRCPLKTLVEDPALALPIFLIDSSSLPVTACDIAKFSARDKVITQVLDWGVTPGTC